MQLQFIIIITWRMPHSVGGREFHHNIISFYLDFSKLFIIIIKFDLINLCVKLWNVLKAGEV